jgi:hypothetical protein
MNTTPNNPNPPNAPDPLAVALSKLDPAPHGFEWNALMFAAGRASKTRALTFWRVVAGICAAVAFGFALAFFTQPEVVVERERVVYVDRAPVKPTEPPAAIPAPLPCPFPVPPVKPEASPAPTPEVPQTPSSMEPSGWTYEQPPEQGAALRWLNTRNEVLTVGLSVLPDPGRKVQPPRTER